MWLSNIDFTRHAAVIGWLGAFHWPRDIRGGVMAFCLMLDYVTGSSWIGDVGDSEYPAMLEDGGGFMFRLRSDIDEHSGKILLQSVQSAISEEMKSLGSRHDVIRAACANAEYMIKHEQTTGATGVPAIATRQLANI